MASLRSSGFPDHFQKDNAAAENEPQDWRPAPMPRGAAIPFAATRLLGHAGNSPRAISSHGFVHGSPSTSDPLIIDATLYKLPECNRARRQGTAGLPAGLWREATPRSGKNPEWPAHPLARTDESESRVAVQKNLIGGNGRTSASLRRASFRRRS